ncbi:MAG: GAF domain-containing protein [Silicimonas sp.]|nr:GAF domain-containing protein [Silicimonas sp.]
MTRPSQIEDEREAEDLFSQLTEALDPKVVFERFDYLAATAAQDLAADGITISLLDEEFAYYIGCFPPRSGRLDDRMLPVEQSICSRVIEEDVPLSLPDLRADPELSDLDIVREQRMVGLLAGSIATVEHGVVGALCVATKEPRPWTGLELRYVEQLSRTVAYTLQAELSQLEQRQLSEELSELDRIVTTLAADLAVPTSIYTEGGDLAFANAALTSLVPLDYVAEFRSDLAWTEAEAGRLAQTTAIELQGAGGEMIRFRVSCSTSASGMMVCHWFPYPKKVN